MKIKDVNLILNNPTMQKKECNFKLKSKVNAPTWFTQFIMNEFRPAIAKLNNRIDNLVKVNNLKE